jgi:hypothetical protein
MPQTWSLFTYQEIEFIAFKDYDEAMQSACVKHRLETYHFCPKGQKNYLADILA